MLRKDSESSEEPILNVKRRYDLAICDSKCSSFGIDLDGEIGKFQHRATERILALESRLLHAESKARREARCHAANDRQLRLLLWRTDGRPQVRRQCGRWLE